MHLLRLRMRMNSGVVGTGTSSASTVSNHHDKEGAKQGDASSTPGVNLAKNCGASKTSTTSSHSHSNKLFIYAVALAMIIFSFASFPDMHGASALPRCAPCPGGECPDPPEGTCNYGVVTNFCGRKVCAKGPGEVCGTGMFKILGTCGDGLYCSCSRCVGCSLYTMECYDKTCTK